MRIIKTFGLLIIILIAPFYLVAQESASISSAEISFVYTSNNTDGSISGFSSSSSIDLENIENSVFQGTVQTETLKTGNFLRDWSLKGSKYFDADSYPTIKFKSSAISVSSDGYTVKGDLTIKKTTKPISITFVQNGKKLTGTTSLYSSDYGIHVKKNRADNKVSVKMVFTLK